MTLMSAEVLFHKNNDEGKNSPFSHGSIYFFIIELLTLMLKVHLTPNFFCS